MAADSVNGFMRTRVVAVGDKQLGRFAEKEGVKSLDSWEVPESGSAGLQALGDAAKLLRESSIPVAFPTETVYGLGANATRSEAVKGIYKAKGRPSDNPLIVHICDLEMLRDILIMKQTNGHTYNDPIPEIYKPLIERFWPGPLTILLPNPEYSILAPEVTAGLKNFGVRMPNSPLALSLIKLACVPIAAPSANVSTKPSTTTAEHVLHDLDGRIEVILDGGSCEFGVESTIVDGLCDPPVILRPGGISINSIRECSGWKNVKIAYKDELETSGEAPRAPGMKYKHYSPKATIILAENSANIVPKDMLDFKLQLSNSEAAGLLDRKGFTYDPRIEEIPKIPIIAVLRTRSWPPWGGFQQSSWTLVVPRHVRSGSEERIIVNRKDNSIMPFKLYEGFLYPKTENKDNKRFPIAKIIEVCLGCETKTIAHSLFSALRELDKRDVDLIYVEGIAENPTSVSADTAADGDNISAAIMNRLRKAATIVMS
jgi:L-threonylcarbamoyladenylate synthase